jgi:hypothetical protein
LVLRSQQVSEISAVHLHRKLHSLSYSTDEASTRRSYLDLFFVTPVLRRVWIWCGCRRPLSSTKDLTVDYPCSATVIIITVRYNSSFLRLSLSSSTQSVAQAVFGSQVELSRQVQLKCHHRSQSPSLPLSVPSNRIDFIRRILHIFDFQLPH